MNLSETDRNFLNQRIEEAERLTKTQFVLATVKRSDGYAEIPWKAFAFGASITGLLVFVFLVIRPVWISSLAILLSVVAILGVGGLLALLTVLIERFARLFLSAVRSEAETRQYGESLFLNRGFFSTESRTGVLLLVSLFERQVFILPDTGLKDRVSEEVMQNIIALMSIHLKRRELRLALETGLEKLVEATLPPKSEWSEKGEFSNEIIEEEGV